MTKNSYHRQPRVIAVGVLVLAAVTLAGCSTSAGYGETMSFGSITCDSEPTGMTCTDANTGHYFRVSRETYQIG